MASAIKRREEPPMSKELKHPPTSPGKFEDIPQIPKVAGDPAGPRMKDKVVIVTGANSTLGIGRAAAHNFAASGARAVYICDYATEHLETHKREINSLYPSVPIEIRAFDATDEAEVEKVCKDAVSRYGRLDVMFANAGINSLKTFDDLEADDFMRTMKGNALATFLCAKQAARAMKIVNKSAGKEFPGGSIVTTASAAGKRSNAGATDYSAAKAAIISLAQTMSYQLTATGIRVNAVCPGIIETGMTSLMYEYARSKGTASKIGQLNPTRRGGVADEVARVALFLASDEASYVNGQAWSVDGGLSAGHPFVPGKLA